jgi:ferric-chelate reductase
VTAGIVALGLPRFLAAARSGRLFAGALGVREDWTRRTEKPASATSRPRTAMSVLDGPRGLLSAISSVLRWTLPLIELDVGQRTCIALGLLSGSSFTVLVIFAYLATLLYCIVHDSPLLTSPNRAGFLALAQLPVVFLLGTKSSVLSFLLGPGAGYEKLNWIHKAAGRGIFLAAVIHGSLWINNRLVNDQPILGMFKESTGIAAFGTLCVLVLSSLRPVRQFAYQAFFALQSVFFSASRRTR